MFLARVCMAIGEWESKGDGREGWRNVGVDSGDETQRKGERKEREVAANGERENGYRWQSLKRLGRGDRRRGS